MSSRPARSTFVTVVAGVFIALSAFSTLMSLLQTVVVSALLSASGMESAITQAQQRPGQPWILGFMMEHFQLFFVLGLVVSVVTLAASIGLLLRKNWARVLFIALMVFGIAWQVAGIGFAFFFASGMTDMMGPALQGKEGEAIRWFTRGIAVFNAITSIAFAVLFAWIIKRLSSDPIRREFGALE